MITNDNIKSADLRIAELKQKGFKNKQIAKQVFPELPIKSAEVKVSRYLNKGAVAQYLSTSKEQALVELKVNWYELMETFTEALEASKTVVHGKDEDSWVEVVPDHTVRMNAAKELMKHIKDENKSPIDDLDLTGMNTLELTRAVLRKS